MKEKWLNSISFLTKEIHCKKNELLHLSVGASIYMILYILFLEVVLGVVAMPFYFVKSYRLPPDLFNRDGFSYCLYRIRRRVTLSTAALFSLFFLAHGFFLVTSFIYAPQVLSDALTWTGAGATDTCGAGNESNWSCASNWSTNTVPTSTDTIFFDGTTASSSIIDPGFGGTIISIQIASNYLGTITQNRSVTTTGSFTINGGTFLGGADAIEIVGDFTQTSGVFTASSATTTVRDDFILNGGTFNHNGGTLEFGGLGSSVDEIAQSVHLENILTLNNLVVNHTGSGGYLTYDFDVFNGGNVITRSLDVVGTLSLMSGAIDITATGSTSTYNNMVIRNLAGFVVSPSFSGGGGVVFVTGTPRTINLEPGVDLPKMYLYGGSTINLSGTVTTTMNTLAIFENGTVNANDANVEFVYSLGTDGSGATYNGGSGNEYVKGGIYATGGSIDFGTGSVTTGGLIRSLSSVSNATINFGNVSFLDHHFIPSYDTTAVQIYDGTVILPAATSSFDVPTWYVSSGATINHNNGTVIFNGGDQVILDTGLNAFNNFTKIATSTQTLSFLGAATTTVLGSLTLQGVSGGLLRLRSTIPGEQTNLNAQGAITLNYLDLADMRNTRGSAIDLVGTNSVGNGNNTGWSSLSENTAWTWVGAGANNNWTTLANWNNYAVPSAAANVTFDATSVVSSTIDSSFSGTVASLTIGSGYTDTITQNRAVTTTGDFTIAGGNFNSGSSTLNIDGSFLQTGGSFTASSATTTIAKDFRPSSGTLNHNNGTIIMDGLSTTTTWIDVNSSLTVANFTINKATQSLVSFVSSTDVLVTSGTLHLGQGRLNGALTIEAQGNIIHDTTWGTSNGTVRITGPARTINLAPDSIFPNLVLNSTSTIVNLTGTGTTTIWNVTIANGTIRTNSANLYSNVHLYLDGTNAVFDGGTGNITIGQSLQIVNGTVNSGSGIFSIGYFTNLQGGTLNLANASAAIFNGTLNHANSYFNQLVSSTIIAPATNLYIGITSTTLNGTFTHNNGTLIFNGGVGSPNQSLLNSVPVTFYNVTKIATTTETFRFPSSVTTTVAGTLHLEGPVDAPLTLFSSTSGTPTFFNLAGTASVTNATMKDWRSATTKTIGPNVEDLGGNSGFGGMFDDTFPTVPGNLGVQSTSTTSAVLNFGAASADVNFREYKIFYKVGSSGVTVADSAFTSSTDSNLGLINYGGLASTTLTSLVKNTPYVTNIWAYDMYNNTTPATSEVNFYTLADVPGNISSANIGTSVISLTWGANSNPAGTQYYIEDVNSASRNSDWVTDTSHIFSGLQSGVQYTFHVKARNAINVETAFTSNASFTTDSGGVIQPPPPPQPPLPPTPTPSTTPLTGTLQINNDAPETIRREVELTMNVLGATEMMLSNGPDFIGATFVPYASGSVWALEGNSGTKVVYGRFRSSSGATGEASDNIEFREIQVMVESRCGNGILETGEACDDGNVTSGDECSMFCQIESGGTESDVGGTNGGGNTGTGGGGGVAAPISPPLSTNFPVSTSTNNASTSLRQANQSIFPSTTTPAATSVNQIQKIASPPETKKAVVPVASSNEKVPIIKRVAAIMESAPEQTVEVITAVREATKDPAVQEVVKKVVSPAAVGITALALTPSFAGAVLPLLKFLFLQPILFLGIRKKNAWGTIYNSVTKMPVDLALVRLVDAETKHIIQTQVTDRAGRYVFVTKPGKYILEVTKNEYVFPTILLTGAVSDGRQTDLYHGEVIEVQDSNFSIARAIPLDPSGVAKHINAVITEKYIRMVQGGVAMGGGIATGVALVINPSWQTGSYLVLHIALTTVFNRLASKPLTPKKWGRIIDKNTRVGIAHAILRLYTVELNKMVSTQVTDSMGRYAFLVGPDKYYLTVEKEGYPPSKSKIFVPADLHDGFIAQNLFLSHGEENTEKEWRETPLWREKS